MIAVGAGFGVFLVETRVGSRAVRIRSELLAHEAEADDSWSEDAADAPDLISRLDKVRSASYRAPATGVRPTHA